MKVLVKYIREYRKGQVGSPVPVRFQRAIEYKVFTKVHGDLLEQFNQYSDMTTSMRKAGWVTTSQTMLWYLPESSKAHC